MSARILTGTCSWTDPTLIECGRFYPAKSMSAEARLRHYASQFPLVEVDSTYYAPPSERNAQLWAARTPPEFLFDVKAFALLTGHGARAERLPATLRERLTDPARAAAARQLYLKHLTPEGVDLLWELHRVALAPLLAAGKLGAVLFQFPPWFTRDRQNVAYLGELPQRLPGVRLAIEFRGGGWMDDVAAASTLAMLERLGLAYVSVDEPQGFRSSTPPLAAATSDLAYVRFHGRNRETWDKRTAAASDRFNYLYDEQELREWVPRVRLLAEAAGSVHVLFNDNYEDVGVRNARQMALLLGGSGPASQDEAGPAPGHDRWTE
jgi:uncharacterized protein YecE (DUF72 family)